MIDSSDRQARILSTERNYPGFRHVPYGADLYYKSAPKSAEQLTAQEANEIQRLLVTIRHMLQMTGSTLPHQVYCSSEAVKAALQAQLATDERAKLSLMVTH